MAASTDKLSSASNGGVPVAATVTATRASGVTSLTVDTQLHWPTGTGIKFVTYKLDTAGNKVSGSQRDWKGVSNGTNTINGLTVTDGADAGNAIGDKVVMMPTAQWGEDVVQAILAHADQSGALLPAAVQTAIGTGGILPANLATGIPVSKFSNPYKFSAYLNTAFTASSGLQLVPFDAEEFDTGNNFDSTTNKGRFTATVAGFYSFTSGLTTTSANNGAHMGLYFYKNGSLFRKGTDIQYVYQPTTASFMSVSGAIGPVQLAVNDYIEVYLDSNNLGLATGVVNTYFAGMMESLT